MFRLKLLLNRARRYSDMKLTTIRAFHFRFFGENFKSSKNTYRLIILLNSARPYLNIKLKTIRAFHFRFFGGSFKS